MATGYEIAMYRHIEMLAVATERIARVLEAQLADEHAAVGTWMPPGPAAEPDQPVVPGIHPDRLAELRESITLNMLRAARSLMGDGYVPDYYSTVASEFREIALHAIGEIADGEWSAPVSESS